jgi:hypothetical protein
MEMEAGPVLNLLHSNRRALAAAAPAQPLLWTRMPQIRQHHLLLQGPQMGRIRAISDRQ